MPTPRKTLPAERFQLFYRNSLPVFFSHLFFSALAGVWEGGRPFVFWAGAAFFPAGAGFLLRFLYYRTAKNGFPKSSFETVFTGEMFLLGAFWGAAAFVLSACLPAAFRFFTLGEPVYPATGAFCLLSGAVILKLAKMKEDALKSKLALKRANRGLIEHVAEASIQIKEMKDKEHELLQKEEEMRKRLSDVCSYQTSIMASSQSAIYTLDLEGKFTSVNPAGEELSGFSREELIHQPFALLVPPQDVPFLKEKMLRMIETHGTLENVEIKFFRKNGSLFFININAAPVLLDQRVIGVVVSAADITRNRRNELLQHARRALLEMLAKGKDLEDILASLLLQAEQFYPEMICSVSILERNQRRLRFGAAPSLPSFFNEVFDGLEIGLGAGACGTAAFIKKRVVVEDVHRHPFWENYLEPAQKAGLRACLSQPVFGAGEKVLGTFDVYYKGVRSLDQNDLAFIDEYAQLVRIAIERKSMEEEILLRNRELSLLYHIASAANKTIEKEQLFGEIVHSIAGLTDWGVGMRARLFIPEENDLVLIYDSNEEKREQNSFCMRIRKGECLCGLAASGEEVIFSENSLTDDRHTFQYEKEPHGHVVIPLMGKSGLNGVLCLYADVRMEMVDSSTRVMLTLAGHQIGMSLDNANLYETVKTLSMRDPLTGLANRRHLESYMQQNSSGVDFTRAFFSVIIFDLDHFKKYNDTHGHGAGDRLLSKVGEILLLESRSGDLAVRYGGEEFLVVLPGLAAEDASSVADRIRLRITEETGVTVSAGVSQWNESDKDIEDLAHRADQALYDAKKTRNRVVVF